MWVVTGSTGHVGNTLVRQLSERGTPLRAMVRDPARARSLEGLEVERVQADLLDYDSLARAFEGAEIVAHCAAMISIVPGSYEALHRINVEGTKNVLRACEAAGVRRLVYVSSIEAIGDARPGEAVNEEDGFDPSRALIEYGATKAIASRAVLEAVEGGLDAVLLCPVGIVGPNDYGPSHTGGMVLDFARRKLPSYPASGGFEFVDVRDVAAMIARAAEVGRKGEAYLITSEYVSMPRMMELLEEATGSRRPRLATPMPVLKVAAVFEELRYKLFGGHPVITRGSCAIMASELKVDGRKAQEELGHDPIPLAKTFADTVAWFRAHGALPPA